MNKLETDMKSREIIIDSPELQRVALRVALKMRSRPYLQRVLEGERARG